MPSASTPTVVLASASPRRRELLLSAGWSVLVRSTTCDETPRAGETAVDLARRLAHDKLVAGRSDDDIAPGWPWLAADTVVWIDPTEQLGKPRDRGEARAMIERLTAVESHYVTTGFAWRHGSTGDIESSIETTRVWMRPLGRTELEAYLHTTEWADKAGGYGIQSAAASWVTRIEGSYTNVVGLPLAQVVEVLRPAAEDRS